MQWILPQTFFKAAVRRCSSQFVFLEFRNIRRKTPVLESLFNKVAGLKACNFTKKQALTQVFPVNIAKFLRAAFFIDPIRWLLQPFLRNFPKFS